MSERKPDSVMLDDFERLLEIGETDTMAGETFAAADIFQLCRFMDAHGRRLLLLARTCEQALARQTKGSSA